MKAPLGNVSKICYNAFNLPVSTTDANGIVTKYAYNDAGLVTRRKRLDVSETLTSLGVAYDAAGRLVREGSKTYRYGYLDKVMSVQIDQSDSNSKGTSYFNDALGTTVGSKSNGKYSAAALTAFGEDLTVHSPTPTQNSNFFTGKPFVEGLGHAFWMRNYRAGLAKWQTADPLGYPDGWNALAYCNNGVTSAVDLWGCADVNYFNESSVEWLAAQKFDRNARITVSAHGSHLGITDGNSQKLVSVTELVERIKATDDYKSGIKVVELASCNVGNGAYAQELVNMLGYGFVVYAPDCYASYDHDTGKVTYYKYREQIPWMPETYEKGKLLRFVKE